MIQMRFEGGKELAAALGQLSDRVGKKVLKEALETAAEPMRRAMEQKAPYEPGPPDIRANIVISNLPRVSGESLGAHAAAVGVGPAKGFSYGHLQEFGTVHHAAQPFMRQSFDGTAQKVLDTLRQALWVELAAKGVHAAAKTESGPIEGGPGGSTL